MTASLIKLPNDLGSEMYFDPNRLVVDFRKREGKPRSATGVKVLRVVVQCFGAVVEDRFFPAGSAVSVGAGKRNTFQIPTRDLPEGHTLIEYNTDGSLVLSVNKHFSGVIQADDRLKTLSELITGPAQTLYNLKLKAGTKGCIEHGTILVYFEEIPDPEKVPPVAIWKQLSDPYFKRWFFASLVAHLLLLLVLKLMPAQPKVVTLEMLAPEFRKVIIQTPNFKPYTPPKSLSTAARAGGSRGAVGREGEGERAPGPEGKRGHGVPGAGARVSNRDINRTGVLDVFTRSGKGSPLSALIGGGSGVPGEVDQAFNRAARYGLPGERELREGKGLKGSGTGGGGRPESIGAGLGTKGRGGGSKGPGLADFGTGRSDTAVSASIDEEEVFIMGSIPKEVIARIIADHLAAIRFCYERQLQVQPSLRGKIRVGFVIGLEGRVTTARTDKSTMGSPPVENCVLGVIRRIEFPKPGGGVVEVLYPFTFRVAG